MSTYIVTRKSDGVEITRYAAAAPVEQLDELAVPFAQFDHVPESEYSGPRPVPERELTKYAWRTMFTDTERLNIDRFNATFESNLGLTDDQKDQVRTGLEDYKAASVVSRDDPATAAVLGLYTALGYLEAGRAQEILNG